MANQRRIRTDLLVSGNEAVSGNATIGGTLSVTGITTLGTVAGNVTFSGATINVQNDLVVGDDLTVAGDLIVTGAFSFSGGAVFPDDTFYVHDEGDPSKRANFDLGGAAAGTYGTLLFAQTSTRVYTFPDASMTVVGHNTMQTLTNKTIDADLNTISNIEDADIKTGAAIARAKIAAGAADHVVINAADGSLNSEAQLSALRGGTGQDFSAATGILHVAAGVFSATAVDLASADVTNQLTANKGGTGQDFSAASGVIKVAAGVFSAAAIVNADIDAAAAIDRTKLASGTADHVLINNGSGVMSSEASLDETRGGTAQTSYVAGDVLYASGANTLAKLTIGTPGQILKTGDAGIPTWEDTNYPTMETRLFEDWHTDAVGQMRWLDADTGSGVSQTGLTVSDSTHHGILELDTGGVAAGAAIRYLGGVTSGTGTAGFKLGGGQLTMDWLVRVEDLSTAGERYSFMVGLFSTAATQVDAVRFFYNDSINAGNWTISCINASTVTNTDSGVAVAADTWYKLRAVVNAAATSVEFFINGVSVGTVTTNIPTANVAPRASMAKTVGAASRVAYVDYFRLYQRLTAAR